MAPRFSRLHSPPLGYFWGERNFLLKLFDPTSAQILHSSHSGRSNFNETKIHEEEIGFFFFFFYKCFVYTTRRFFHGYIEFHQNFFILRDYEQKISNKYILFIIKVRIEMKKKKNWIMRTKWDKRSKWLWWKIFFVDKFFIIFPLLCAKPWLWPLKVESSHASLGNFNRLTHC